VAKVSGVSGFLTDREKEIEKAFAHMGTDDQRNLLAKEGEFNRLQRTATAKRRQLPGMGSGCAK
jgi:predicted dithiol-disulfide oxidoreductase (DUF899 family)